MKFVNPYLLNLLWGLIPVAGIMVYGILKRKKILLEFARLSMLPAIAPGFDLKRQWGKTTLIMMAFGFFVVALAGPQLGYRWEKTTQKGVDIMIALDCSKSMLAEDIQPNRLERAKREIIDLLHMLKSDRAGLVAFSGKALLQCPLTLDHEAFNIFLKVLNPEFLPVGGTDLDAAIQTCYSGFEKASDTQKAIIVITDGESTTGTAVETAKEMAKQGIKIFCIGVGGREGAPIPDVQGGFKKDASGNIVLSKVDEKGLQELAAVTGGAYVRSVAGDMDLDLIYTDKILGTMERKTLTSGKKKVWENRYQWFLFPGLILLLIEMLLPSKKKTHGVSILIFAVWLAATACPSNAAAQSVSSSVKKGIQAFEKQNYEQAKKHFIDAQLSKPDDKTLYYNIGVAAYMNEEYDQAQKHFRQAVETDDVKLRHDARYNLANTHFRMGDLDEAIKGYEDIIKEFPEDTEAKENLAFAKQKKKEQQQQQQKNTTTDNKKANQEKENDQQNDQEKENGQEKKPPQGQASNQKKDQGKPKKEPQSGQDKYPGKPNPGEQGLQDNQENSPGEKAPQPRPSPNEDTPGEPGQAPPSPAEQNMDKMLNRLDDKPGRAMMPGGQGQQVEKDW